MIEISNLTKSFGSKKACNISKLVIENGEIIGLVGNNGAGKTTLFRLMLDLLKSDTGDVKYCFAGNNGTIEINPSASEEWKHHTGAYINEGFLIDYLTPEEYFQFLGKISNITAEHIEERLKEFEQFTDGEVFGQKKLIRDLSSGNRQKVGIISAFIRHPQLVILDEPFNFLDPKSQNILKKYITSYNESTGATIIISSHNLSHTIETSHRIILLEDGEVIQDIANTNDSNNTVLKDYFEV